MKIHDFLKEEIDNPTDSVTVDVPLLIRLLEYAREDAKTDMDLHNVAERLIHLSAEGNTLTMQEYDSICPAEETVSENAEYDDEAGMVKSNLVTIMRSARELKDVLHDNENMAEWAQEKVAIVKSMIVTVKDYVFSQHQQALDTRSVAEDASGGGTSSGGIATSMGGGWGKSVFMSRTGPIKTKKRTK